MKGRISNAFGHTISIRAVIIGGAIFIVTAILVYLILLNTSSKQAAKDEVVALVTSAVVGILFTIIKFCWNLIRAADRLEIIGLKEIASEGSLEIHNLEASVVEANATIRAQQSRLEELEPRTGILEITSAFRVDSEIIETSETGVYIPARAVILWRVRLENRNPNSLAQNVRVTLSAEPGMPSLPVELHEMHDNQPPFRRQRNIRSNEPLTFDLISQPKSPPPVLDLYLYRADLDPRQGFIYELSTPEVAIWEVALRNDGVILTVHAVADPPSQAVKHSYRAFMDAGGVLWLEDAES